MSKIILIRTSEDVSCPYFHNFDCGRRIVCPDKCNRYDFYHADYEEELRDDLDE